MSISNLVSEPITHTDTHTHTHTRTYIYTIARPIAHNFTHIHRGAHNNYGLVLERAPQVASWSSFFIRPESQF